jgi:hypothetical protein
MFKNESHSIREWIRHYLLHGVEHFYLINDNSTDNFMEQIQEYVDLNMITLFNVDEPYYLGRQRNLYNKHILPILKETQWLLMVDLDEYVWSKLDVNLVNVLKSCEHLAQIQICETLFGSNGHIIQPEFIVKSFTKRKMDNKSGILKYVINNSYDFESLNVHHADFVNKELLHSKKFMCLIDSEYLRMNHYRCQSQEFWNTIKCTRGDSDNYCERTYDDFYQYDVNEIEELELYNQNKILYKTCN